tara:strand:- start:323 stop:541 length:219 start_codon:yes stop_codon:yes gene_type:complete
MVKIYILEKHKLTHCNDLLIVQNHVKNICPPFAIDNYGVIESKCYGCGRWRKSYPLNLISKYEFNLTKDRYS